MRRIDLRRGVGFLAFSGLVLFTGPCLLRASGAAWYVNTTASEPYGVYRIERLKSLERGRLVVLPVPESVRPLVVERRWLPPGWSLLKGVGALPGDRVCVSAEAISVNDRVVGPVSRSDSEGRPLPALRGCETVRDGTFWPLSTRTPKSFDARYFGAQPVSAITGEAEPLWTF